MGMKAHSNSAADSFAVFLGKTKEIKEIKMITGPGKAPRVSPRCGAGRAPRRHLL